jgi:hypothetical protein
MMGFWNHSLSRLVSWVYLRAEKCSNCAIDIASPFFMAACCLNCTSLCNSVTHSIGLIPIQFVQKVRITWTLDEGFEPLRDLEYWPTERFRPTSKVCFNALRQIKHKGCFDMELRIVDHAYGMGQLGSRTHFAHLLKTFRPVYTEFLEAGATIKIYRGGYHRLLQDGQRCYP